MMCGMKFKKRKRTEVRIKCWQHTASYAVEILIFFFFHVLSTSSFHLLSNFLASSFILILIDFATLIRLFGDAHICMCVWTRNIWIIRIESSVFSVGRKKCFHCSVEVCIHHLTHSTVYFCVLFLLVRQNVVSECLKYNSLCVCKWNDLLF